MKIHVHNHAASCDSFEESKHKRANNGQFGAGEGKTHAEHAEYHHYATNLHFHHAGLAKKQSAESRYQHHLQKADAHNAAYVAHKKASLGALPSGEAHEFSRRTS